MANTNKMRDLEIYERHINGQTIDELAKDYGIHRSNISRAINRITKANAEDVKTTEIRRELLDMLNDPEYKKKCISIIARDLDELPDGYIGEKNHGRN